MFRVRVRVRVGVRVKVRVRARFLQRLIEYQGRRGYRGYLVINADSDLNRLTVIVCLDGNRG